MSAQVTLTNYELFAAAIVGVRRHIEALQDGLTPNAGFDGEGWEIHIQGACGEQAYAKYEDRFWSGSVNTFKSGGDVGLTQIRTRSKSDYDLIVREADRDDDYFVLVIGTAPTFKIVGWIQAKDAKQPQYLKEYGGRPPAFFIPQAKLQPFEVGQ